MSKRYLMSSLAAAAALIVLGSSAQGEDRPVRERYSITDLDIEVRSSESGPRSINDAGEVAGTMDRADGSRAAFLYRKGRLVELGPPGGKESRAVAVNNRGQVAGIAPGENGARVPVLWLDGKAREIGLSSAPNRGFVPANGGVSIAGLNDRGEVAGSVHGLDEVYWTFLWRDGKLLPATTAGVGLRLVPAAINDRGQIAGYAPGTGRAHPPSSHATVWTPDPRSDAGTMRDLGTLGPKSLSSRASDINNHGHVVGAAATDGIYKEHAFLWDGKRMRDLGALGGGTSEAHALNDRGQVVGTAFIDGGSSRAFLWHEGRMLQLDTLIRSEDGWDLMDAIDVNERGQIIAVGFRRGRQGVRGVLLTPP